ncbi:uncharacterized protein L969DRAFT_97242 [Mixia osmundae IAM 14324]|uniref:Uncharacterized protein n=1 Tax=Mixia osmundae (strain CBS 9802 / IAM 14324 / JCM 22182 / KY 12970) TaxID=764103 RepID=G7DWA7_MIXOS|nr:uncharacterized protein L969DRAFT_97242 [Mixia osmundae IAM 14324]KEI36505.1 hypothetical protein L969DRAFT_97242 [Mixia osmundae IAM 14324]GAA94795.1 hypothetical protein E5Q_01449 [Mixia osmundae IAM 14324]
MLTAFLCVLAVALRVVIAIPPSALQVDTLDIPLQYDFGWPARRRTCEGSGSVWIHDIPTIAVISAELLVRPGFVNLTIDRWNVLITGRSSPLVNTQVLRQTFKPYSVNYTLETTLAVNVMPQLIDLKQMDCCHAEGSIVWSILKTADNVTPFHRHSVRYLVYCGPYHTNCASVYTQPGERFQHRSIDRF